MESQELSELLMEGKAGDQDKPGAQERDEGNTEKTITKALRNPDYVLEARLRRKVAQKVLNEKCPPKAIYEETEEGVTVVTRRRAKRARHEC